MDEDHLHLFRDCWESSILWNYIFSRLVKNHGLNIHSFFHLSWIEWIGYNLKQSGDWKMIFYIAIWHIWKSRNQAVFKQKMVKTFSVYNVFYVDYITTNKILQGKDKGNLKVIPAMWTPPSYDYLKLNTDGRLRVHNNAGDGGVFRGATGRWYMGYLSKFNAITPLAAELYAMWEGFLMAVSYEIQILEIETDAQALLTMLGSVNGRYHEKLKPVLTDVAGLMGKFKSLVVKHIPRANNKVARALAQYALEMTVGHNFFLNPPPFASIAYQGDLQKLEDAEKKRMQQGSSSSNAIDLEEDVFEEKLSPTFTTEIIFGSISTTVTTTAACLTRIVHDSEQPQEEGAKEQGK